MRARRAEETNSMTPNRISLLVPLLAIGVGTGWLLTALKVVPDIDWIWTVGLAAVGVSAFAIGGIDKVSIVIGTFFILASVLSVMRQSGFLSLNVEVPILVIISGVLMLIVRNPAIPLPEWLIQDGKSRAGDE